MRAFHLPPQILRLVLLTVGIVGVYLTARYFLTPASFGQYGWFRGNALGDVASSGKVYGGMKACDECHSDHLAKLQKDSHRGLSCETCHGPCQAHADDPDNGKKTPDKKNTTACMRCHEANPSRPKWHKQITLKNHYVGQPCTSCHVPHQPNEVP
jgi:hypothetical protein